MTPHEPNLDPYFRPLSELSEEVLNWLWPGRLPLGKLVIIEGDPGLGKSLVTLDLAARLSTGRPWPDGTAGPGVGRAVILNAEDGVRDTVLPRLRAAGADLGNVLVHDLDAADARALLRLPAHTRVLDEALTHTPARLLVLDPLMAFLDGSVNCASDQSVRTALVPLAKLAERHRCTFLLTRHLNKSGGHEAMYRGGGSIAFAAVCRCCWLVARDPEEAGRCVMAQVKNNLSTAQSSLAYRVKAADGGPPVVEWLGGCGLSSGQLLAQAGVAAPPADPARERAAEFLLAVLREGPLSSRHVWARAKEHGFSQRTLHRAKEAVGIESVRTWTQGRVVSYWLLPGQTPPEGVATDTVPPSLKDWLGPLVDRYPPPSPLDDL
jgi:hypothetical protein